MHANNSTCYGVAVEAAEAATATSTSTTAQREHTLHEGNPYPRAQDIFRVTPMLCSGAQHPSPIVVNVCKHALWSNQKTKRILRDPRDIKFRIR